MEERKEKNMQTIVYLIRHSKKLDKGLIDTTLSDDNYQIAREKIILSSEGEERAKKLSDLPELQDVETIYSSDHVRAIQTAKYLAEKKQIKINIDSRFNERKGGIYKDVISLKEYYQDDYKNSEGESPREVRERTYNAFNDAVKNNKGKKIAVFGHGASLTFLLTNWCKLENIAEDKRKTLSFNGEIIFDKIFGAPEVFKIIVDDDKIISVENIELGF